MEGEESENYPDSPCFLVAITILQKIGSMKYSTLAQSTLWATNILLLLGTPAYSASLTLLPLGSQLDGDQIPDRATNSGEVIQFSFQLNTAGLTSNLTNFAFSVARDPLELPLIGADQSSSQSAFPNFSIFDIDLSDPRAEVRGASFSGSGVAPNTVVNLLTTTYQVGILENDGLSDLRILEILMATDENGNDVSSAFQIISPGVDVQARVPEPSLLLGLGLLGVSLLTTRKKTENL